MEPTHIYLFASLPRYTKLQELHHQISAPLFKCIELNRGHYLNSNENWAGSMLHKISLHKLRLLCAQNTHPIWETLASRTTCHADANYEEPWAKWPGWRIEPQGTTPPVLQHWPHMPDRGTPFRGSTRPQYRPCRVHGTLHQTFHHHHSSGGCMYGCHSLPCPAEVPNIATGRYCVPSWTSRAPPEVLFIQNQFWKGCNTILCRVYVVDL